MTITAERLRQLLHYDVESGIFTRLVRQGNYPAGSKTGSISKKGYFRIKVDGEQYYAHRLAVFYMTGAWPPKVDHRDCVGLNNRWENLRKASSAQNSANQRRQSNSSSGFKGVSWDKRDRKWRAQIGVQGRKLNLGYFATPEAAHNAYLTAAVVHFGEFARGNS